LNNLYKSSTTKNLRYLTPQAGRGYVLRWMNPDGLVPKSAVRLLLRLPTGPIPNPKTLMIRKILITEDTGVKPSENTWMTLLENTKWDF
jgi:hypothetical protein